MPIIHDRHQAIQVTEKKLGRHVLKAKEYFENIKLHRDEVHLWDINFDLAPPSNVLSTGAKILSPDELAYAGNCAEVRKREFLVCRFALRVLLTNYFPHIAPRDWSFGKNSFGKPLIIGPINILPVQFNVSHSSGRAVIAFSMTKALGVDLERIRQVTSVQTLAESCFSAEEISTLAKANPYQAEHLFFNYWTLKESFIKALGQGLSVPLDQFSFNLTLATEEKNLAQITIKFDETIMSPSGFWTFKLTNPASEYQTAVAVLSDSNRAIKLIDAGNFSDWDAFANISKLAI